MLYESGPLGLHARNVYESDPPWRTEAGPLATTWRFGAACAPILGTTMIPTVTSASALN